MDATSKSILQVHNLSTEFFELTSKVAEIYSKRFPEYTHEKTQIGRLKYIKTVLVIGNHPESVKDEPIKAELAKILDPKACLSVVMKAAATKGVKLEEDEMRMVVDMCKTVLVIHEQLEEMYSSIESQMSGFAPNLTTLLGSSIATRVVGKAGGLEPLSTCGSWNDQELLENCDIIKKVPVDYQRRVMNILKPKVLLAARLDRFKDAKGELAIMDQITKIEKRIEILLAPPKPKAIKPLPKPIDKARKRRGGKRRRKEKEKFEAFISRKNNRTNLADIAGESFLDDVAGTSRLSKRARNLG